MNNNNLSRKIIYEALCCKPSQKHANHQNQEYMDDDRELLLDDVAEVLNEIYHTLVKDYKLRFKKP